MSVFQIDPAKMAAVRLAVATPVRGADDYCAQVTVGYHKSVRALERLMTVECIPLEITYGLDCVRARNRIAATILRDYPAITHTIWWDDDQWPDDPRLVQVLLQTGEDLIGAAYTRKREPVKWVHQHLMADFPVTDYLMPVAGLGFGFTLTSTRCLRTMSDAATRYTDYPLPHKVANIFGMDYVRIGSSDDPDDVALHSEDFSFCERWRRLGGRAMLFAGGLVEHAGTKRYSAKDIPGGVA